LRGGIGHQASALRLVAILMPDRVAVE
jgi:hypothetical protein